MDGAIDIQTIRALGKKKGIQIILTDEICNSWGYNMKKRNVSSIGSELSKLGYDIKINHIRDPTRGIYKIYLKLDSKNVLIYSNNSNHKSEIVKISSSPKNVQNEIIAVVINLLEI